MAEAKMLRRVRARPSELTTLVADVERYPEFIGLLSAARVSGRQHISEGHERFEAAATVSYKFLRESFYSTVDVYRDQHRIVAAKSGTRGAVKHLENRWDIHELSDGSSLVDFYVNVKLRGFGLETLLRDKFDKAGDYMINKFEQRAKALFEPVGDDSVSLAAECERLGIPYRSA